MSKDGKFGTFGGVFTPSVLTILGVIMYLRLPWVVGNAGLYQTVGIIVVAHLISISTGLSISSIATDKGVGGGGPYYIVSRSLGLPIGGTLGLALFVGLAFSISLYVIGFSESFLDYLDLDTSKNSIRICGTAVIVLLTVVTFISTAFAIKTQYLILGLIVLSLVSIGFGAIDPAVTTTHVQPHPTAPALPVLFAIFFPAVTGFTAGVNMSGDLRSPKSAIPRGTMLAIVTGLIVYIGLTFFLAARVSPDRLINDPALLINIAWSGPLVVAGIWGATISSALGSILGSPRILQAISADGITPRYFAKGFGPGNEPRNALTLAFAIGEAGILIGELDTIARIVSMIFLATYGFLNITCAIESSVSPDFRPDFRIPKSVSVAGAVTCILVMIQLDLLAMFGAVIIMSALFFYLQRRQLKLESGDAWEGIWASLVRSGLHRLARETQQQQRNWNPNVLHFRAASAPADAPEGSDEIVQSLVGSTGILTHVNVSSSLSPRTVRASLNPPGKPPANTTTREDEGEPPVGIFQRELQAGPDREEAIERFCAHYGFAGIEPNTVLLDWDDYRDLPDRLAGLLLGLYGQNYNQLVLAHGGKDGNEPSQRIDLWWREQGGNLPLALALARFITAAPRWEKARLRFILLSDNLSNNDVLRTRARRYFETTRVDADIKVISNAVHAKSFEEWVLHESGDADLLLIPLPDEPSDADTHFLTRMARLVQQTGDMLLLRASSHFEEVLSTGRAATDSLLPAPPGSEGAFSLSGVELPTTPAAAELVQDMALRYEALLAAFDEHCVASVHSAHRELLRRLRAALERQSDQLEKGGLDANPRRRRQLVNRVQSAYVAEAGEILQQFQAEDLADQRAALEGRIEAFLFDETAVVAGPHDMLKISPDPGEFVARDDDPPHMLRLKRSRRFVSMFSRGTPTYVVPVGRLQRYYFERAIREILVGAVERLATESHQLAVHLGKTLSSARSNLTALSQGSDDEALTADGMAALRKAAMEPLGSLVERVKDLVEDHRKQLLTDAHGLIDQFRSDVERIDSARFASKERKLAKDGPAVRASVTAIPASFVERQGLLLERAALGLQITGFQHRLMAVCQRHREATKLQLRNGALRTCEELAAALRRLDEELEQSHEDEELRVPKLPNNDDERFDPKEAVSLLTHELEPAVRELPVSATTISDACIDMLEEGIESGAEVVEVQLQSLAQFLIESELVAGVYEEAERAPELEARAMTVARDVVRLISFQLADLKSLGLSDPAERTEQLRPAIHSGLERIDDEVALLRELVEKIDARFDIQLERVVEGANAHELTRAGSNLTQHRRIHQGKLAMTGARGMLRSGANRVREMLVALLYRGSAGVVRARGMKSRERSATVIERLRATVASNSPSDPVLSALPFYYRQLFFGQAVNESLWVGREEHLARAKAAIHSHRDGATGVVIVTGERGGGKSALCQRIAAKALDKRSAYWVRPPLGGATKISALQAALQRAVEARGSYDEIFDALPDHAAVIFDDLELWWERTPQGFAAIDEILDLVARFGDRILFVFSLNTQAFELLTRLRPVAEQALAVIECGPMDAQQLGEIITLRHGSTGLKYELAGRAEGELTPWQTARLFSQHFAYCHGLVGSSLRAWVTHVERVRDGVLTLRAPGRELGEDLDDLHAEWRALLLELLVHRRLTLPRLVRITGMDRDRVRVDVDALIRMGLVVQGRQRALEINPFVHHVVAARFAEQGLLS